MSIIKGILHDTLDGSLRDTQLDYATSSAASSQAVVNVGDGTNFAVGESCVIYDGGNLYETVVIESISTNALTMTSDLTNTYPIGSKIGKYIGYLDTVAGKFRRPVAPDLGNGSDGAFDSTTSETWSLEKNYTSITINAGHTITIDANVNIKCQGSITIASTGKISALGEGHSGGAGGDIDGFQGVSCAGTSTVDTAANYGGGGGGGHYSTHAWGGGGGGGYSVAGTSGGSSGSAPGGSGGGTYNDAGLTTFTEAYLKGSGGGGGAVYQASGGSGGTGGAGGGIIRLHCKNFVCAGEVDCDGADGVNGGGDDAGGGGGGSGGTIFIVCQQMVTLGTALIHSDGGGAGAGGTSQYGMGGGAGGAGRIRIEAGGITGTTSPTYATGYYNSDDGTLFSKYGFYHTIEQATGTDNGIVNCRVKMDATQTTSNLDAGAASGQAELEVDATLGNTDTEGSSSSNSGENLSSTSYSESFTQTFKMPAKGVYDIIRVYNLQFKVHTSWNFTDTVWAKITDSSGTVTLVEGSAVVLSTDYGEVYTITFASEVDFEYNTDYKIWFRSAVYTSNNNLAFANVSSYADGTAGFGGGGYDYYFLVGYNEYTGDVTRYDAGSQVVLWEDNQQELFTISSIDGGTITLDSNLTNTYTTAAELVQLEANAYVSLVTEGSAEEQIQMDLKDVTNRGSDVWDLNFMTIIKTEDDNIYRNSLVGRVDLLGASQTSYDINITEVLWSYY